ncbi:hypothetical protein GCM10009086_01930 [Pseudomonas rhodesiae]
MGGGLPPMASVAALQIRAFNDQVDYLLDGSDVIPILLRRLQVELPLDLHDKAGQIIINNLEVMDEVRLLRDLASVDKADDIDE